MNDDLFRPTVATTVRDPSLPPPFRIASQIWVALFGGCFSLLAIAWINTHRLGGDWRRLGPRMVGWTLGLWALVTIGAVAALGWFGLDREVTRYLRFAYRAAAVVLHVVFARIQEPLDRRYRMNHGEEGHASLWGPGLLAILVGGLVQGAALISVTLPVLGLVSMDEGP